MPELFSEFQPSSKADWEKQVIKDLKGETPDSLNWINESGFVISAIYSKEDLHHNYEPAFTHKNWELCVKEQGLNDLSMNKNFLIDLNRGASSISLRSNGIDFENALKDIELNFIHATFYLHKEKAIELKNYLQKHYNLNELHISLFPIHFNSEKELIEWQEVQKLFEDYDHIKTLSLDLFPIHEQGALPFYEIAVAFAQMNEMLSSGTFNEKQLVIKTGVTCDHFIQIAKLRAYRRLWNVFKQEFQITGNLHLIVENSLTNKSLLDQDNNLIRSTIEAMSAAIGGCNELVMHGFSDLSQDNNALSQRMAINQQLILKHESYLDQMADISCGSYYIETLTDQISERALLAFKEIEKQGGYFSCKAKNIIDEEIKKQASRKMEAINSNQQIIVGVNKFIKEKSTVSFSQVEVQAIKTMYPDMPVLSFELTHNIEA